MNPPNISGYKRSLQRRYTNAKAYYEKRPNNHNYEIMRRLEVSLQDLKEYIERAEKG